MSAALFSPSPYAMHADPAERLVTIRFIGLWGPDTPDAFVRDLERSVAGLGCAPGAHRVLVDTRGAQVQPGELLADASRLFAALPNKADRVALVLGGGLIRLQAKRVSAQLDYRVFDERDAAHAWLTKGVEVAA